MKVIILFLLAFAPCTFTKRVPQADLDRFANILTPYVSECRRHSNVDIEKAINWEKFATSPSEYNLKRYIRCIYKGLGFYSADGAINSTAVKEIAESFPGGKGKDISVCLRKAETFNDLYESAYQFNLCAIDLFSV